MDTLCPGLGAWHEMKLAIVIRFAFPNSVGSPYGDPDVVDASLGTLTQQRQQEVLIRLIVNIFLKLWFMAANVDYVC